MMIKRRQQAREHEKRTSGSLAATCFYLSHLSISFHFSLSLQFFAFGSVVGFLSPIAGLWSANEFRILLSRAATGLWGCDQNDGELPALASRTIFVAQINTACLLLSLSLSCSFYLSLPLFLSLALSRSYVCLALSVPYLSLSFTLPSPQTYLPSPFSPAPLILFPATCCLRRQRVWEGWKIIRLL